MHGRLKVKTTAEQEETKRKEREKKLKLYQAGTGKLFLKQETNEYDTEGLKISGELLSANPDFYTLWNYRRQTFLHLKDTIPSEEVQASMENELGFLEQCLRINPKSYGTWHHRGWVLQNIPQPDWERELKLCNKFLEYDERNFHCWDYRRLVVKESNVPAPDELQFTTDKIESNFSNYSSWHYRSKLLPLVHPDRDHPVGVSEQQLVEECLLAQNAFFTDPGDQSAWFYHKWLLGRATRALRLESIHVCRGDNRILIQLSNAVKVNDATISLCIAGEPVLTTWSSADGEIYSNVWMCDMMVSLYDRDSDIDITLTVCDTDDSYTVTLPTGHMTSHWRRQYARGKKFCHELSAVANDTLTQELSSLQQLHELEPDNKWVLLTIVSVMRALDPLQYEQQTFQYIEKLLAVDIMRSNYYIDLKSRFQTENALERLSPDGSTLDLSGLCLTTLSHTDCMVTMETINLSHNTLDRVMGLSYLQSLRVLILDANNISSCRDIVNLASLEELSLCDNKITSTEDLQPLRTCRKLTRLHLKGNPVCENKAEIVDFLISLQKK